MGTGVDNDRLLGYRGALDLRASETPQLRQRLQELRAWQAARLARTYGDLHRDPRYGPAVDFFLSDLYGPSDFTRRDRDIARAWRTLKRVLPVAAVSALTRAMELDLLTTELDHAMAAQLPAGALTETGYAQAYCKVGRAAERKRQIDLTIHIGEDLERIVRHAWIGAALRAAHIPAHAAGLGTLQGFLERGYASFRRLQGAQVLLDAIRERETNLMNALFGGMADPFNLVDQRSRGPGGSK